MSVDSGLAGLVAAETVLSHADGPRGMLWVRGHTLEDLVANHGYDGAVGLLWEGFAGTGLDRLVKTTVFLIDLDDFGAMNEVYASHVGSSPPARATVQVAALPSGARVEIEAIALAENH